MAVAVNFGISELADSSGFLLVETTGPYSASNTSGWGSPNTAWSTAYYAQITIHDTDGNLVGGADVEYAFTLFDSTPSSTVWSTPKMSIVATDYGLDTFTDGVYRITYTARQTNGGTVISTKEKYILFDSHFQVNMKEAELEYPKGATEGLVVRLCTFRSLGLSCFFMVESGNYTTAQELITRLVEDTADILVTNP